MSIEIKTEAKDLHGRSTSFAAFGDRLRKISVYGITELYDVLVTGGHNIRNRMISSMKSSPAGRSTSGFKLKWRAVGWHKVKAKVHAPSKPGNAPRPHTGDSIRSINVNERIKESAVEVGSTITKPNYPKFLEFGVKNTYVRQRDNTRVERGGRGKWRIQPRPWAKPAYDMYEPEIKMNLMRSLRSAIERAAK